MGQRHLVLLGDSTLDNGAYTRPQPDSAAHVARLLGAEWTVELLAQDGAVIADLPRQLSLLRGRPHLAVLSIGGNDLTPHIGLLERRRTSAADLLGELLDVAEVFGRRYETAARSVADRAERTMLCTIYEAPLEPASLAKLARVPLAVVNDRILRTGIRLGLELVDLRDVCTQPSDFVLQIEPSAQGAEKIARAIALRASLLPA